MSKTIQNRDSSDQDDILLTKIQRLANLGYWEWDIIENTVNWSDELYRIYGIDADNFLPSFEGYIEMLHPDDRDRVVEVIQGAISERSHVYFEERIVMPDSGIKHLKSWGSVVTDKLGNPVRMFGVCLDVTESKRKEIEIQLREEELEQRIQKRTQELEEQNIIIKKQKLEIEDMFKEVHHRVKNNMQIINSLIRIQARTSTDPEVLAMFQDCQNRISTMALIHEKMYQAKEVARVDSKSYLTSLITDIVDSSQLENKIKVELNIDSVQLTSRMLVPIGMIVNEMITNSIKHAFEGNGEGTIFFEFGCDENGVYEMIIGDDGSGVQEGDRSNKESLGMDLIETFVDQLDGTFKRLEKSGTVYQFEFTDSIE